MHRFFALAALSLLGACAEPSERPAKSPSRASMPEPFPSPSSAPVATGKPSPEPAQGCPSRAARLAHAQETIRAFRARAQAIVPIARFVEAHRCELRDTTGTVLVTRTREPGGTRLAVAHGRPDEIVCDVPAAQFPEGLDVDAMREIAWLDATGEGDPLVTFGPACQDAELEVTFGDRAGQERILGLR